MWHSCVDPAVEHHLERYGTIVGNDLRIVAPEDLDDELAGWVAESYAHGAA